MELLNVVIPARDEEACIASTVEHLHVELRLHDIPHEIIVVDDGSTDRTREIINEMKNRITVLKAVHSPPYGFGRAIIAGLDEMQGDAVVLMMAMNPIAAMWSVTGKHCNKATNACSEADSLIIQS